MATPDISLDPASILVTGAGGYVGRHVVTALADLGYDVVAVVRPGGRTAVDPRARVLELDLLSADVDLNALFSTPPAALVHLAWQDGFAHNADSHIDFLPAHLRLLKAASTAGVGRVAVLGTMHEIGYWEGAIDADTPTNPLSLYGIAKDALRRATFSTIASTTQVQWLRCYYIYGDDRSNRSIFTKVLEKADSGATTFPFTSGKNRYDFIDVAELGRQIAVCVTTEGLTGTINCCVGEPVSLAAKVEEFIAENGLDITLEYGAYPDRPYDSPGVWGDATQIREIMQAHATSKA